MKTFRFPQDISLRLLNVSKSEYTRNEPPGGDPTPSQDFEFALWL